MGFCFCNVSLACPETRFIVTLLTGFSWWPLIFYPVTDAPNYRKGYIASLVTGALIIPLVGVIAYLERKGITSDELGRKTEQEARNEGQFIEGEAGIEAMHMPEKY